MSPRGFLCEEAKIKQLQRKNFVKFVRTQYGNPDSHAFLILFFPHFLTN